jgi:hypothetical protein
LTTSAATATAAKTAITIVYTTAATTKTASCIDTG